MVEQPIIDGPIRALRIPRSKGLDPITVYLEEPGAGQGRATIVCYNQSWTCFWGSMGARTLLQFIASCDEHYVSGNMLTGRHIVKSHERDYAARVARAVIDTAASTLPAPQTPSSRWSVEGKADPHGATYDCERAALAHGDMTDDELANAVFLTDHRKSFDSIGLLTAAKDRIRWLSRRLQSTVTTPQADRMAIRMMVATGHVTETTANTALSIAHGFATGSLTPPMPEGVVRERLTECRDWFETQAKAISKGSGSTWDLMQVREQRDLCDAALSAPLVFANAGDSEATFIADGERLNCPACGGSGHKGDAQQVSGLPERDPAKPSTEQGAFRKFDVRRTDGSDQPGGKHHGCDYFVLDVTHDRHSFPALAAYIDSVEATHPELAVDMRNRYGFPQAPAGGEVEEVRALLFAWALVMKWRKMADEAEMNAAEADSIGLNDAAKNSDKSATALRARADELQAALSALQAQPDVAPVVDDAMVERARAARMQKIVDLRDDHVAGRITDNRVQAEAMRAALTVAGQQQEVDHASA